MGNKQLYTWKNIVNDNGSPFQEWKTVEEIDELDKMQTVMLNTLQDLREKRTKDWNDYLTKHEDPI